MLNLTVAATQPTEVAAHALSALEVPQGVAPFAAFAREAGLSFAAHPVLQDSALATAHNGGAGDVVLPAAFIAFLLALGSAAHFQRRLTFGWPSLLDQRANQTIEKLRTEAGHPLPSMMLRALQQPSVNAAGYKLPWANDNARLGPARRFLHGAAIEFTGRPTEQTDLLLQLASAAVGYNIHTMTDLKAALEEGGRVDGCRAIMHPTEPKRPLFVELKGRTVGKDWPERMNPGGYLFRMDGGRYCTAVPTVHPTDDGLAVRMTRLRPVNDDMMLRSFRPWARSGERNALAGHRLLVDIR